MTECDAAPMRTLAGNFSVGRLMEFLNRLGQDVRITVKPTRKRVGRWRWWGELCSFVARMSEAKCGDARARSPGLRFAPSGLRLLMRTLAGNS